MFKTKSIYLNKGAWARKILNPLLFNSEIVQNVFKLDIELFHQKQPNCELHFLERTTENEN